MKRLLLITIFFLSCTCMAQTDTVFWFAPPDLSAEFGETPIRLVFHTYDQPATVTVEQPANSSFSTATFVMPADGVQTFDLSAMVDDIETKPVNTVLNRGFYIHSTAPITCYYQSVSSNRETYTLKGGNALGTDFQVVSPYPPCTYPPDEQHRIGRSFEIVATEDSTIVTITTPNYGFPSFVGNIGLDSTLTVFLNRGQSYAMRGIDDWSFISKTKIHSTYPIAVNSTADHLLSSFSPPFSNWTYYIQDFNLAGEQMLPLQFWGTHHVWFYHQVYMETHLQTDYIDTGQWGERDAIILNAGIVHSEFWDRHAFTPKVYYEYASRPVTVYHVLAYNQYMAFSILPQLTCAGSHKISYLHSDTLSLIIDMVVESHAVGDILFNGDSNILTAADFQPIPENPSLSWCVKDVSQMVDSDAVMTIQCSTSKFILGVVETGIGRGSSYTILTDYAPYASVKFKKEDIDTVVCSGSDITFSFDTFFIDSLAVHCPGGSTIASPPYVVHNADTSMSGIYIVEGFTHNECHPIYYDTINIHVHSKEGIELCDTINENQLPWHRFDTLFYAPTDTVILRIDTLMPCDSVIHYHLVVKNNIFDTVLYYACPDQLPVQYDSLVFYHDSIAQHYYTGSHGEDSIVTFIFTVLENSDTTIYDTIIESQLPWYAYDTVFTDTVADYLYHLYNEAGCDSLIHYNLFIYWNGDHCDTTLEFPNFVTPNGDGTNDRFVIKGLLENNCFKYNELIIFDRTGHQVYHRHNIATEDDWWDPAARRHPGGTYFYYFKAHGVTIHTQHIGVIEVLTGK